MEAILQTHLKYIKGCKTTLRLMEVCGTHTHRIAEFGLRSLLPQNIRMLSGPGCPVCVTEEGYIDATIRLLAQKGVMLATFGDMLKVRGTQSSLAEQKAEGKAVKVVLSPEEVLELAQAYPKEQVVFLAVGFETTAPLFAALIRQAQSLELYNLCFFTALKRLEPILHHMLGTLSLDIDGILCPGHVAAVMGAAPFLPITQRYGVPAVIGGFEADDILAAIQELIRQATGKTPIRLVNLYKRCVREEGNPLAKNMIEEMFLHADARWRGIGCVPGSAYAIRGEYGYFDAVKRFGIILPDREPPKHCACGEILLGVREPPQCPAFGAACTPEKPLGPCMVSSEGSCAAYYKEMGGRRRI